MAPERDLAQAASVELAGGTRLVADVSGERGPREIHPLPAQRRSGAGDKGRSLCRLAQHEVKAARRACADRVPGRQRAASLAGAAASGARAEEAANLLQHHRCADKGLLRTVHAAFSAIFSFSGLKFTISSP